jgi:hypothetical protein
MACDTEQHYATRGMLQVAVGTMNGDGDSYLPRQHWSSTGYPGSFHDFLTFLADLERFCINCE